MTTRRSQSENGLPDCIAEVFQGLWQDVCTLHWQWASYRTLYGTSPERVDLLSSIAPDFFGLVERTLLHDVLLSLVRMSDPAHTRDKENLSLPRLIKAIPQNEDSQFLQQLKDLMDAVKQRCAPFRQIRNRRMAHRDLPTALKHRSDPLPGVSREAVELALQSIRDLMNHVSSHYEGKTTCFEGAGMPDAASELVGFLEQAKKCGL